LIFLYGTAVTGFCLHQFHQYQISFEEIQPYSHYYETSESETESESITETVSEKINIPAVTEITETSFTESETIPVITELLTETAEILTIPETEPVTEIQFPLELNQATFEELCTIPEIGAVRAQNIIEYREAHGGFLNLQQLLEVHGIGETIYQKILPYLYLETEYPLPEPENPENQENPENPEPEPTEPPEETLPPEPPVINLNTATKEQLLLLPDCDEALADEILTLRDRDIHIFHHILEITLAEHVTPELFSRWENYLTVADDGSTQIPYTRFQDEENQD
jgi:competence protein ComEA